MAGVAQLVRASVCGTECRQFESGHPPHKIQPHQNGGVKFYLVGPGSNCEEASSTRRRGGEAIFY